MKHQTSLALHAYWQSCQRQGGVPAGGIQAIELAPILPSLFLIDFDAAAGLIFRFCGATVATRYGRDLSNESFLALWNERDRSTLESELGDLKPHSGGLVAGVMAETLGGGFTAFEMLLLPLAGRTGAAGAIGSMARTGGHDEMNRIRARIVSQTLSSVRFLTPLPPPPRPFAGRDLSANPGIALRRRYGHLTVVSGGRTADL